MVSRRQPALMLLMFYNGSESEGREVFKAFIDLGLSLTLPYGLRMLISPMS